LAFWFFVSLLLRMSIALAGFYFVSGGHWKRLLACLLGFIMARLIIIRITRAMEKPTYLAQEAGHAP
jgi:F1F0 ATPase subunit 2